MLKELYCEIVNVYKSNSLTRREVSSFSPNISDALLSYFFNHPY